MPEPVVKSLSQRLSAGEILIADGAAGTMLMAAGLPLGTPPDAWNLDQPEQIVKLHRAYVEAGSDVILTNTFGATRIKLGKSKAELAGRVREINLAAAQLARQAARPETLVAGDIGPTGELMKPFGKLTPAEALEVFSEQAAALAEGGVDAIWVETMTDLEEARAAVTAARQVTNLPVLLSLSFGRKGRTMMGISAKQAATELWSLGLAAIGANCGEGLEVVELVLKEMRTALPDAPLIAKPNAGMPRMVKGQTVYDTEPGAFAERIQVFTGLGAQIVGACCGSSPEYIAAIEQALG